MRARSLALLLLFPLILLFQAPQVLALCAPAGGDCVAQEGAAAVSLEVHGACGEHCGCCVQETSPAGEKPQSAPVSGGVRVQLPDLQEVVEGMKFYFAAGLDAGGNALGLSSVLKRFGGFEQGVSIQVRHCTFLI